MSSLSHDGDILKDSVCAVCQHDWPQDNSCTLLCQSDIQCPLEFHTYCLDPPLTQPPEDRRDWLCPACHVVGTTAHLWSYLSCLEKHAYLGQVQREFNDLLGYPSIIGNCIRLSTLSGGMHTGLFHIYCDDISIT
jgi:hypothetical protein